MLKMIGGVLIGVFVGAAMFEILARRNPNLLRRMEERARSTVKAASDAFKRGYQGERKEVES